MYLLDTPGVLPPRIESVETGMKLALCGEQNRIFNRFIIFIRKKKICYCFITEQNFFALFIKKTFFL